MYSYVYQTPNKSIVTSPSSTPQVTFLQATRGVSNENGLCQARHMARVEANFLVHASLPCLVK